MNLSRRIVPAGAIALMAALSCPVLAESSDAARIKELERKLERSLELIEQLSQKINQIEQTNKQHVPAKAAPAGDRMDALERQVTELGASMARQAAEDGLTIHGFADVGIQKSDENNVTALGRKGAALGTFVLYLTPQFGDRVRSLVELAFETERNSATAADIERMQIGYAFSDRATAWVGRFHTPYGYWNTAFHHGAQIQTSILRPRFLDFEEKGGILPAHTTGLWVNGAWGTERGRFGYDLFAGNAPQINEVAAGTALSAANPAAFSAAVRTGGYAGSGFLNMRASGSDSHRTAAGFNAWIEPRAVDGLRLGAHGLRADVVDDAASANRTLLKVFGGYFTYQTEPWEALGEYYRFGNEDRSGSTGTHRSWAGYAQLGYNSGRWTPYARAERTKLDQSDNYFAVQASGRSYRRVVAGLRYDIDPKAALKVEFNSTRKEDVGPGLVDSYPELRFQYAVRF